MDAILPKFLPTITFVNAATIEINTNGIATICSNFTYPEPIMLNQSVD